MLARARKCSLVPYDIFPLFPCSPKALGDPHIYHPDNEENTTVLETGFIIDTSDHDRQDSENNP